MQPFTFFISYRRQDTAPIALLLKNEIEKRLQFVRVSADVQEMAPGDYEGWYVDNYGNSEARYLVEAFKFPHFNQAADFMAMAR